MIIIKIIYIFTPKKSKNYFFAYSFYYDDHFNLPTNYACFVFCVPFCFCKNTTTAGKVVVVCDFGENIHLFVVDIF